MYRQLYQMGGSPVGIATMPMDFGQSLQVNNQGQGQQPLMSQAPNYSSAVNITANPLLNYGQSPLGDAGGTPLTMRSGGITRLGYANGDVVNIEDQMMQQAQQSQQPQQPPLQGMEGQQPDIKDPKQALEIIVQMLIAQGIPPEQARQIALQMVQAVAEGGMKEMSDERVEARFGGYIGRQQYGFGSIVSGIGKAISGAVKGVTNAVKSVASSPLGKAALTAAAIYFGGPMLASATEGTALGSTLFGSPVGGFGLEAISTPGLFGTAGTFAPMSGTLFGSNSLIGGLTSKLVGSGIGSSLGGSLLTNLAAGALGGALAGGVPQQQPGESNEDYQTRVNQYKLLYQQGVSNPTLSITNAPLNLYPGNPFYAERRANGGRIGYQEGGIGDLIKQTTQQSFFGTPMMAMGGRIGYELGSEVPVRENQAGIKELDYRDTGGFVPPIGIKERADDIPAMLSNNEFVFTADAVRNAGGGDENLGAKRMYTLMKQLESGGSV